MRHLIPLHTDQTNCYNELGEKIPCIGSGQDAEIRQEPKASVVRFEITGDIVIDGQTGLKWSRNANPATFPISWPEAFEFIEGLNTSRYLGRKDWRLPSRRDLYSLVSHQRINPALPAAHPFASVQAGSYCRGVLVIHHQRL